MNTIATTFCFGCNAVRTAGTLDEPMFCLKDVCKVLGTKNHRDVSNALHPRFKGVVCIDTPGGKQDFVCVTEQGLYRVLIRTRSKVAEPFQDWLCEDVLPSIRKTGRYENKELMRQVAVLKDTAKTQHNLIQALSKENRKYNIVQVLETDRACQQALSAMVANDFAKSLGRGRGWGTKDLYDNAQRQELISEFRKRIVYDCSMKSVRFVPDSKHRLALWAVATNNFAHRVKNGLVQIPSLK
jgi:prophage antirepressor-like protein